MAIAVQLADECPQALPQLDVDAGGGLVEHDDRGLVNERLADEHAALHSAGQRAHVGVGFADEVEMVKDLVDPRAVLAHAEIAGLNFQRFAHGEEGVEHQLLRHDAKRAARAAVIGDDVVSQNSRGTAIGACQPRDDRNERCLAGPIGPKQAEELAFGNGQIDARKRLDAAEATRDVDDLDGSGHQPLQLTVPAAFRRRRRSRATSTPRATISA